jgi:hypothetical protein
MKKLLAILAALILVLVPVATFALTPPDNLSFQEVRVFRNLANTGEMLVVFHARVAYAAYPTTPASGSIIFRMYDGTDLLAVSRPYAYASFETNGYGDIISAFYLSDNESPAWGGSYTLNIQGAPAYYSPDVTLSYTLSSSDYSSAVDTSDAQLDLYNTIMSILGDFVTIYPDVNLKASVGDTIVLTSYGESYLRGAIPGIQIMCPQLFYVMSYVPAEISTGSSYNMTLQTQYTARLDTPVAGGGTSDLKRGANRLGSWLGVSGSFALGVATWIGCLILIMYISKKGHGMEAGLFASALIMAGAAMLVGSMVFTVFMVMGIIATIAFFFTQVWKRSPG